MGVNCNSNAAVIARPPGPPNESYHRRVGVKCQTEKRLGVLLGGGKLPDEIREILRRSPTRNRPHRFH